MRTRTQRLFEFSDVNEAEKCLNAMAERDTPLVVKLPREAEKRESRYMHLTAANLIVRYQSTSTVPLEYVASPSHEVESRLESDVIELKQTIAKLVSDNQVGKLFNAD